MSLRIALIWLLGMLTILHVTALNYKLYFYIPWLDMVAHTLGGICVALAVVGILRYKGIAHSPLLIAVAVLGVGIGWELFEYGIGAVRDEPGYAVDTMSDILMDLIGGVLGAVFSRKLP